MDVVAEKTFTAVSQGGRIGWMALVSIAALAMAGFAIYAIVKITLGIKRS